MTESRRRMADADPLRELMHAYADGGALWALLCASAHHVRHPEDARATRHLARVVARLRGALADDPAGRAICPPGPDEDATLDLPSFGGR